MLFSRYYLFFFSVGILIPYLMCVCVCVTSNLLVYSACIWRWGSLQRETGTPGSFRGHTTCYTLPACSAPGHSSLGTQSSRAPGMWHRSHYALRGAELAYHFRFISFHPTIWTGAHRWMTTLCFFLFLLWQIVSLLHSEIWIYDLLGFFLYGSIQSVEYVSFCYMLTLLTCFIISSVHVLVWSSSFLHAPHLYILVTRSFFSKSVSLCLQAVGSFVSICRLHREVIYCHISLSLSLLLPWEWSSPLSFLRLIWALFPISLWLRCIALCTCTLAHCASPHLSFYS